MTESGLDGLLILQLIDRYYYTGTLQEGILWLPADGPARFWVRRSLSRARQESPLDDIRPLPAGSPELGRELRAIIPASGRIGLELDILPVNLATRIENLLPDTTRVTDGSPLMRRQRAIKSDYEINLIRQAAAVMDTVMAKTPELMTPGISEFELLSQLDLAARRMGHLGIIRMRGWNSEILLGHILSGPDATRRGYLDAPTNGLGLSPAFSQGASRNRIQPGVPVSIDFMVNYEGYMADMTRVLCLGELPAGYQRIHQELVALQQALATALVPGKTGGELYEFALELVHDLGLEPYFMGHGRDRVSFIGHGIGLEVDEFPFITRNNPMPLSPGMVVALEPKLILPPGHRAPAPHSDLPPGVVSIEDTFLITEGEAIRLTLSPQTARTIQTAR